MSPSVLGEDKPLGRGKKSLTSKGKTPNPTQLLSPKDHWFVRAYTPSLWRAGSQQTQRPPAQMPLPGGWELIRECLLHAREGGCTETLPRESSRPGGPHRPLEGRPPLEPSWFSPGCQAHHAASETGFCGAEPLSLGLRGQLPLDRIKLHK